MPVIKVLNPKLIFVLCVLTAFVSVYFAWVSEFQPVHVSVNNTDIALPLPVLAQKLERKPLPDSPSYLPTYTQEVLSQQKDALANQRRQTRIDKVENFFKAYGSPLVGYGHIFVDQSEACGGDYRVLVGIAGSESGLGRVNVLKYNPFGYLDNVQYSSQEEALIVLSCRISEQHISKCGSNLWCLAYRYTGPGDDLSLFVSKIAYFFSQVN